jgi:DNA-binding XRE family transcriptional regulator
MCRHPSLTALGRNLRESRRSRGLTQEKLAELADLDPTYISGIERGIAILASKTSSDRQRRSASKRQAHGGGAGCVIPEDCFD